jgi:hypothetical protein
MVGTIQAPWSSEGSELRLRTRGDVNLDETVLFG